MNSLKVLLVALMIAGLTVLLGGGCATKPEVNWTARVGTFTYDDAVQELGAPARQTQLSSGMLVAEWVTGRAPRPSMRFGTASHGGGVGGGVGRQFDGDLAERVLRLTFDAKGVLENWTRNY